MRKTILLTGASGVVGQALVEKLATRHELICLTHRAPVQEGVAQVSGDLTQPHLGLDTRRYADLARRIDVVVHCAAVTHFGASAQATRGLNVDGTRRILELAAQTGTPVYYLGTAFVARVAQAAARRSASERSGTAERSDAAEGSGAAGGSSPVDYLKS